MTKSEAEAAKAKGDEEEELRFEMKGEPKEAKKAPSLDIFIMNR